MGEHCTGRLVCILVSVLAFIISLIFNGLAVVGISPFTTTTANISAIFDTQITPIGWTFQIWAVIYAFLIGMNIYILTGICRRNSYGYVYCSPAVLPYGFYICWCINMSCNIAWLILWDQGKMLGAFILLIVVVLTNYAMIAFSCHGLAIYGAWLYKYHKVDVWLLRILVQNGLGLYTTWTTIATLINLSIVLGTDVQMSPLDAATVSYSLLTAVLIGWFILENFVFDRHVRYLFTIYPVVLWALSGNYVKNFDLDAPNRNGIFIAALLGVTALLSSARTVLVIWRSIKQPLYGRVNPDDMQPMEVAARQKKVLC